MFYHSVLCSCENVDWLTKPYFIYKKILYMEIFRKVGLDGWRCHGTEAVDKGVCLGEVR